jgi:hypothetical protein
MRAFAYLAAVAALSLAGANALAQSGSSSTGLANPPTGSSMGSGIGAGGNSRGTVGGSLPVNPPPSPGHLLGISPSACAPGSTDPECRDRAAAPLSCEPGDHDCLNTSGRTRRLP